jgi:lysophospholipase L1-like esterase
VVPQTATTYVAIGASDAFGVGTDDPAHQCWPAVLAAQLGSSVRLINLGIPGETTSQAVTEELPVALAAHPSVVTILLGTNDLVNDVPLATSTRAMTRLLASLHAGTTAHIYLGNLPDLTLFPFFSHEDLVTLRGRVEDFNSALGLLALEEGATLVDLYTEWSDLAQHPEYISPDGLHPSAAGDTQLARLFLAVIHSQAAQGA